MSVEQAQDALGARELERAEALFTEHLQQRDPTSAEALLGLAVASLRRGQLDRALGWMKQLDEGTYEAALMRGLMRGERGERAAAQRELRALVARRPHDPFLLAVLAEQSLRQGLWEEGAARAERALNLDERGLAMAHLREVIAEMSEAIAAKRLGADAPVWVLRALIEEAPEASQIEFFQSAIEAIEQGQTLSPRPLSRRQMTARPLSVAAEPTAFHRSMSEERRLNDALQTPLGAMDLPEWPSDRSAALDPITSIPSSHVPLREQVRSYREDIFRITQGDIFSQLYMERCYAAMASQIPTELTGPVPLDPSYFSALHLNLLDGALDAPIEALTSVMMDNAPPGEPRACAFAYFIGEAMARAYGGVWSYDERAEACRIWFGALSFKPYELAEAWLKSTPHQAGAIYEAFERAARFGRQRARVTARRDHVDATANVSGPAVAVKLAELWALCCVRLARQPFVEIAHHLEVIEEHERAILFTLKPEYTPSAPRPSAKHPKSEATSYVYWRARGEFLMLSDEAMLARALGARFGALGPDNAPRVVEYIARHHAPGAILARDEATGLEPGRVSDPRLEVLKEGAYRMTLWFNEPGRGARRLVLQSEPDESAEGASWFHVL